MGWSQSSGDDFDWSRQSGGTPSSGATGTGNHHGTITPNDSIPPDYPAGATGGGNPNGNYTPNDSTPPDYPAGATGGGNPNGNYTPNDSTPPDYPAGATGGGNPNGNYTPNDSTPPTPQSAILISPCFDISRLSGAQFSFQYRVWGPGANLQLEISTDGTSWTQLWSTSGNQNTSWNTATISLKVYQRATSLKLRFNGTVQSHSTGGTAWQGEVSVDDLSVSSAFASSGTAGRRNALGAAESLEIKAFPNPFQDQLSVAIPYLENQTATVALYDLKGSLVFVQSQIQSGENFRFQPPVNPGVYLLKIQLGDIQYPVKVIKSK